MGARGDAPGCGRVGRLLRRWRRQLHYAAASPPPGADVEAPAVAVSAPANFASGIPAGMLTFSATATDNVGVASVEFQVDGVAAGAAQTSAPYAVSVDTNAYASGQHVLRVRARDAAGNQSAWTSVTVSFGGSRTQPARLHAQRELHHGLERGHRVRAGADGRIFVAQQGGAMRVVKTRSALARAVPDAHRGFDRRTRPARRGVPPQLRGQQSRLCLLHRAGRARPTTASAGSPPTATWWCRTARQILSTCPICRPPTTTAARSTSAPTASCTWVWAKTPTVPTRRTSAAPLGKMLRFNDDGTIPSDNPFCTTQGNPACAVWAYGLRNPFTFAVQPGTGRIHINDVGEVTWEEINLGAAGRQLRLAEFRGTDRSRRHHRAATGLSAQRDQPARVRARRILHRLRDHRRRVLSGQRAIPCGLPR